MLYNHDQFGNDIIKQYNTPGNKFWKKYLKVVMNGCYVTNPVNFGEISKSATPKTKFYSRPVLA